jgi:hypothetical protein
MSISVISFVNTSKHNVSGAPVTVPNKAYAWTARLAGSVNFHVGLVGPGSTNDPLFLAAESTFLAVGANQDIFLVGTAAGVVTVSEVRSASF